jgi:hypothetical protein
MAAMNPENISVINITQGFIPIACDPIDSRKPKMNTQ